MRKSLEKKLKEAGATEDQIRDLNRMMDADKKRLKRRNMARTIDPSPKGTEGSTGNRCSDNKYALTYVFFSALDYVDDDGYEQNYEPVDERADVEAAVEQDFLLEELREHLCELPLEDLVFLYEYFAVHQRKTVREIAEMFDMKVWEIYERRDRLIKQLRKMFEEE